MASTSAAFAMGRKAGAAWAASKGAPHLVLHFDINETIMVGDPAGGDSWEQSLNKIIAKSAFVQVSGLNSKTKEELAGKGAGDGPTPTHWYDGTNIAASAAAGIPPPPLHTAWEWPEGAAPLYRVYRG